MKLYTNFYVKPEDGVVICKVVAVEHCGCIYNTFIGKAVCQPEDTFDEVVGRRIAETKAHIKMHRRIRKDVYQEYERLSNQAEDYANEYNKETDILFSLYDKLNSLKGEN